MDKENNIINNNIISVGNWLGTIILLALPVVNIIAIIYFLTSSKTSQTKKNYIYASLVLLAIAIGLSLLLGVSLGSMMPMDSGMDAMDMMGEMEVVVVE